MKFCVDNINLVLFLPLIVCFLIFANSLIANRLDRRFVLWLSGVVSFICLLISGCTFRAAVLHNTFIENSFLWLSSESVNFYIGTLVDGISGIFLFLAAVFSFALQFFACVKLRQDSEFGRLMVYLNLFSLGLFGVFLSPNILQAYMLCEVVGVASYLLINFDFSNRNESRAAIKSYIFNRIGDLTLLFCVITILYFSVTYNQLTGSSSLAFSNMSGIAESINSLMSEPLFVGFCSVLIFVVLMKFMQAFIYLTFDSKLNSSLSKIILFQNSLILLIGLYLFFRFNVFFVNLGENWIWALFIIAFIFVAVGFANKVFFIFCKIADWFEKYVIETVVGFIELVIRSASYLCCRFQAGTFQSYLIYSFIGLSIVFLFILMFYLAVIKI